MPPQSGYPQSDNGSNSTIEPVLVLHKKMGQTPLECIEEFRATHPQYAGLPMTYAGRLDPLATGVLIVLTGEECKMKDQYIQLDKEYEVTLLFGIGSDTHDVLGVPTLENYSLTVTIEQIRQVLMKFTGTFTQSYPAFSSKTINGTPLFELARAAYTAGVTIGHELPTHQVTIFSASVLDQSVNHITASELLKTVSDMIHVVRGDFRQEECLRVWNTTLAADRTFATVRVRVYCSHGTYMRQLAADCGKALGTEALALRIHRSRVGKYGLTAQA
jgi:tRNA pseudouridine55 synthase